MNCPALEPDGCRLTIEPRFTTGSSLLTLVLAGELDVHTVEALCESAVQQIASGNRHLHLDLASVTRCDNASLFVILGVRHALHAASGHLDLVAVSEPVQQAIARNGLGHVLHT
ncbi:STAS domain-containing protein [Streptomyces monticola]|uniref:STAS domain-containing protein n=1 Tax=Streptomyces monticola TaxID=2666263 RepID=A0ABW2JTI7_9ACTN